MKESCEVFGETIEGENREELYQKVSDKLLSMIEAPIELKNKRIEAKLAAKQRLLKWAGRTNQTNESDQRR